jgi:integrase
LKQLLKVVDDEWRGMILFGFYIGQRLGDIAGITRQKLDLKREEVKLRTDKTGRLQILPLAAPLLKYVKQLRLGDDPPYAAISARLRNCRTPGPHWKLEQPVS